MSKPLIQTTGRRKEAVARVRLRPGTGKIVVNGREFASYFPILTHQVIAKEPLRLTQTEEVYDVDATLGGGGVSGQAGAIRLGIARALVALDPESRGVLKKAGLLTPRRAREGTAQVRPQEGAQGAAVLEAVALPARRVLRFGTDGVRGDADERSHDPFVVALGRAVARVLGAGSGSSSGATRARRARASRRAWRVGLQSEVARAVSARCAADAGDRVRRRAGRGAGRDRLREPQPVERQRREGRSAPTAASCADDAETAIEAELELELGSTWDRRGHTYVELEPSFAADAAAPTRTSRISSSTLEGRDARRARRRARLRERCRVRGRAARACATPVRAVHVLHAAPDGRNINDECGSTHPEELRRAVVEHGAALGLALDGDGDRVLAVDERGELVDGDQIMAMTAIDLHARGVLRNDAIAVTVMSNLGLRRALRAAGIGVVETPVGDRHVVAAMQAHDLVLGGEQSGHIVYSQYATTGDGLLTGLLVADLVRRTRRPLSALAAADDPGTPGARERPGRGRRRPRRCRFSDGAPLCGRGGDVLQPLFSFRFRHVRADLVTR